MIDLGHIEAFNNQLSTSLRSNPSACLALVRLAFLLFNSINSLCICHQFEQACQLEASQHVGLILKGKDIPQVIPEFQVILQSTSQAISLRSLTVGSCPFATLERFGCLS